MLTALLYVLIIALIAAVLFLASSAVFGRGEELAPLPAGTTATMLPESRWHRSPRMGWARRSGTG